MEFKDILQQSGMNMSQFAKHFNIPYRTVQNWYNGDRKAPEYVLELIKFRLEVEAGAEAVNE